MIAIDLPPKIAFPKPAIVRAAGDLHRHDRRAIEREFGVRLPERKLAMLPGMMPVGWGGPASGGGFEASFVDSTAQEGLTGDGNITFSSHAIGDAALDRLVAVSVTFTHSHSTVSQNSLTVGGISATKIVSAFATPAVLSQEAVIWIVEVPTGISADIVVGSNQTTGNNLGVIIGVYRLIGASPTPVDIASDNSSPALNLNLNVGEEGLIVAAAAQQNTNIIWTGITERANADGYTGDTIAVADHSSTAAETPRTVTATAASFDTNSVGCAASFGPA